MKIALGTLSQGMFDKTDSVNFAEFYTGGDTVTIVFHKGRPAVPVSHITLDLGELLATLNFESQAQNYRRIQQLTEKKQPIEQPIE